MAFNSMVHALVALPKIVGHFETDRRAGKSLDWIAIWLSLSPSEALPKTEIAYNVDSLLDAVQRMTKVCL